MKSPFAEITIAWLLLLSGMAIWAQEKLPSTSPGELTHFTIPERNKEGVLIWQLKGTRGVIRPDGKMEIDQLVVNTFRQTNIDWTLSSPKCVLNRETREAISEEAVNLANSKMEITGVGFHWLANESRFIIRSKVKVMFWSGVSKGSL